MKFARFFMFVAALFAVTGAFAQPASPVKWNTKVEHVDGDVYRVLFEATIEGAWHLYDLGPYEGGPNPTAFEFEPGAGLKLDGKVTMVTKPHRAFDDIFGMEIGYFEKRAVFAQRVILSAPKAKLNVNVEWMVCDDSNCLPPTDEDFTIEIVGVEKKNDQAVAPVQSDNSSTTSGPDNSATAAVDSEPDASSDIVPSEEYEEAWVEGSESLQTLETAVEDTETEGSLWSFILEAMLWGLVALVTPCVFPMIPMTVSFFMKGSESPTKGRFNAIMYGVFIVILYTLPIAAIILVTWLFGGDSVMNDIFNWISTHWFTNILFFLIFMVFAASFFGAFELRMPSKFINKSDSKSDKGGLIGVFFMALTLVLVSFSCTGPLIGMAIIKSTAGEFWTPIVVMLAFSTVFAIPFALFAFFPTLMQKMPKSGGWLNSVKVVLGFVEVALGLKFLSVADQTYHWGILDREIYLAIWIVVGILLGLYLLGKIKFAHDSDVKHLGVGRLALVIITFTFVVYLIPGMWGAPLKALSGYMPPLHTQDFVLGTNSGNVVSGDSSSEGRLLTVDGKAPKYSDFLHFNQNLNIEGFFDLEEAKAYGKKVGKPVFIDFTGHGCVNCREMESRVWTDPEVNRILREEYVIVAIYVDDKKSLPESEWVTTDAGKVLKTLGRVNAYMASRDFGANSQPYYTLLGDNGQVLIPPRGYNLDIPAFIDFLNRGIEAYKNQK